MSHFGIFNVIQGKLGSGKSLMAVNEMIDCIYRGIPVATNIDLFTSGFLPRKSKKFYYRVPDKPKKFDIECLPVIHEKELDKMGVIVLDECASWLNSRDWQSKDNQEFVENLLYIRKKGWRVFLLIQDISALDKQARNLFCEVLVSCRRTDRMAFPFMMGLGWLFGLCFKIFTAGSNFHVGSFRYGNNINAPAIGTKWLRRSKTLEYSYDTSQLFSDNYNFGTYCPLPNSHKKRPPKARFIKKVMKLTKIYFAKNVKTSFYLLLMVLSILFFSVYFYLPATTSYKREVSSLREEIELLKNSNSLISVASSDTATGNGLDQARAVDQTPKFVFDGRLTLGDYSRTYFLMDDFRVNSDNLESMGYGVIDLGCSFVLVHKETQIRHIIPASCS